MDTDEYLCSIREELRGIRQALERALPGGNQEALKELVRNEVIQMFRDSASSAHTHVSYE